MAGSPKWLSPGSQVECTCAGTTRRLQDYRAEERNGGPCKGGFSRSTGVLAIGNDPSAGSPTETLLRLLLPLNDQV